MNNITTFVSPRGIKTKNSNKKGCLIFSYIELKKNDVFINRNSGDFYTYIEKDLMWIPEGLLFPKQ